MRLGRRKEPVNAPVVLPDRGESVVLSVHGAGHIPARVLDLQDDEVTVAITVPTRPLDEAQLASLELEFTSSRGRVRLRGSFTYPDPSDHEVLSLHGPRSVEVLQEREYVRIRAARPVFVTCDQELGQIESYTVDVSGGGLLLAGPDTLRVGETIRFRLAIKPRETPVTGTGKVVRIDSMGRRAIAFEQISDGDRGRLVHFIFECQRSERRLGLGEVDDGSH